MVVTTVDNILAIDNDEFQNAASENNSPTRILKSLKSQISNVHKQGGNFSHTGRNIDVTALDLDQDLLTFGLGYAQMKDSGNTYDEPVGGRVFYDTSQIDVEETDVAIILPDEIGIKMSKYTACVRFQ